MHQIDKPEERPLPDHVRGVIEDVAHQVNNHLAVILGRVSLLALVQPENSSMADAISVIDRSVRACHEQMNLLVDLLDQ